jgi:hypothetical protein
VRATYAAFTRRHPRYKVIGNKTIGAALIDLRQFSKREHYLDTIKGKNRGAWHARRARTRGYVFAEIDRNEHVDAIHDINTSVECARAGRWTAPTAKARTLRAPAQFRYYGVLDAGGQAGGLRQHRRYGNFSAFSQLIGHRNNDGIMHLLVTDIVCRLIDEGQVRYVMYDTFFGAQPGPAAVQAILGFQPYRAKYILQ